jgi:hypothetical protein
MKDWAVLSKRELIDLVHTHRAAVVAKDEQLRTQCQQLREQDIALQTKDRTIERLTQERGSPLNEGLAVQQNPQESNSPKRTGPHPWPWQCSLMENLTKQ